MPKITWKAGALLAVIVLIASIPLSHLFLLQSDAYAAANKFISASPDVAEAVGSVKATSIPMLGPSLEVSGSRGSAEFDVTTSGDKGEVVVSVSLEKRGIWSVVRATLSGGAGQMKEIPVSPANHSQKADGSEAPQI